MKRSLLEVNSNMVSIRMRIALAQSTYDNNQQKAFKKITVFIPELKEQIKYL